MFSQAADVRKLAASVVFALILATPVAATAWLLQVPPGSEASTEDVERFSEASKEVLRGAAELFDAMAIAEGEHIPLEQDAIVNVSSRLFRSADIYSDLAESSLRDVPLEWDELSVTLMPPAFGSRRGALMSVLDIDVRDGADLAQVLAVAARRLGEATQQLAQLEFGPERAASREAREVLNRVFEGIDRFGRVANAGTIAMLAAQRR